MATRGAAEAVLRQLEQNGYEAYFVGGCVRDLLLGRPVHDWDITTSARPEQVMACFERCIPTGLQHGTVTVREQGESYEVTTFRADGGYADGRHPDAVQFVGNLAGDLSRRDFTVNAMAMDVFGNVTDLHGGREDLAAGLLRCVGEPVRRFSEDALRMLRAVRFSAQLGFAIETRTAEAMASCASLCSRLSAERVRDEMERTLLTARPEAVLEMVNLGMLTSVGLEPGTAEPWITAAEPERTARWAALKLVFPQLDWNRLRMDRKTAVLADTAAEAWQPVLTEVELKRLVARHGWEAARCVCRINGQTVLADGLERSGQCLTLGQLAVTGRDFPELAGPQVGKILRRLLEYVLEHPDENTRARLLELAGYWIKEATGQ